MKGHSNKWLLLLGAISLLVALALFAIQFVYMLLHDRLSIEYVDDRLFYLINISVVFCLFLALLILFSFKKVTLSIISIIVGLFMIGNVYLLWQSNEEVKNITSISPDFKHVFSVKKGMHGLATYYRTYYKIVARPKEMLTAPVRGDYKVRWLTNDVAVFTYETHDQKINAFVGTYGDRNDGISYYNVGPEIQGTWHNGGVQVVSEPEGIEITENGKVDFFTWDHVKQFGTLAISLTRNGEAMWTVALNEDFHIQDKESGTISLYKTRMENEEIYQLQYMQ